MASLRKVVNGQAVLETRKKRHFVNSCSLEIYLLGGETWV